MDRRSFLKLGALTASSGVVGACGQVSQKVIPYVVPPDDGVNPVDGYWYATTCRECNAGCGVMVRTVNGRAKKIEGNPEHPISGGKTCVRGQAAVQRVYHRERLSQPMVAKGGGKFDKITWDKAISMLGDKLAGADGKVFYLNDGANDITAGVASAVFGQMPGFSMASNHEPGKESLFAGGAALSEYPRTPYPDMENAEFSILLGADIFESDRSPVFYGRAFGQSRRGRPSIRGRMVYIGSRLSATASACDRWLPSPPGKLGKVALSVAQVIVDTVIARGLANSIPRNALGRWSEALGEYAPEKVSEEVEIEADILRRLAKPFIEEAPAIIIAGDDVAGYTNGVAGLDAVEFINMISYEIGREKLRIKHRHNPEPDPDLKERMLGSFGQKPDEQTFEALKKTVDGMAAGDFQVGLVSHTNPVFDTPAGLKFKEAFSKVPFKVVFANFMDETAAEADLVLPDHHWLESWSAQVPDFSPGVPLLNLQQPVIRPFLDTRPAADVLLAAAERAGMKTPGKNGEEYIRSVIVKFRAEMMEIPPTLSDSRAWQFLLRKGGWWPLEEEQELTPTPDNMTLWNLKDKLRVSEPEFSGGAEHKYHLHLYQTVHMGRGEGANQAWLQEAPDPMTTLMWQSWIEMNPATAAKLGVIEGELVTVSSPHGSITGPVFPFPGIRPEVIAVPIGYGHTNYGKYGTNRGANPMNLLGADVDSRSGGLAWRSQKVSVKKAKGSVVMLRNAHPKGEYKGEIFQL